MNGTLEDVFEITGRGCVAVVKVQDGNCKAGDTLSIGGKNWQVTGMDMPNYGVDGFRRINEGWNPPVGLLIRGAKKAQLVSYIGTVVGTVEQPKDGK